MKHRERGAALVETVIALPVVLVALCGVTWGVRVGTIFERAEGAVRYAGVISAQQSPYFDYSFFALYNNLFNAANVVPQPCQTPQSLLLSGGKMPVVPGTPDQKNVTPPFWQPDATSIRPTCQTSGRQAISGTDLSRSFVMIKSAPQITATVSEALSIGDFRLPAATVSTVARFYRSPDLATLMHCEALLGNPVSVSLQPQTDSRPAAPSVPLTDGDLRLTPIPVNANCPAAPGAQPTLPPSIPFSPLPGSPAPTSSPHAPPSPSPSPSLTPRPSPSPSPKASPSPAVTPTSGGGNNGGGGSGGGGGKGGGTPTPSPSPHGGGGPGGGGGVPTGPPASPSPSGTPRTPAPSITPSTPKPSATPHPTAPPTPTPAPTSNGTIS